MTTEEIMELAEKSRNAINDVAHLCSGEVEEHIFDMGFYSGYNLAKEIYGSKGSDDKNYTENYTDNYPELDGINNLIPKQETLYTEEQLREAMDDACIKGFNNNLGLRFNHLYRKDYIDRYIQSLKQPKKD